MGLDKDCNCLMQSFSVYSMHTLNQTRRRILFTVFSVQCIICVCTVYMNCVRVPCTCTCTVNVYCVRVLCTWTVYVYCVRVLCTCTVYVYCGLCTFTVHGECERVTCACTCTVYVYRVSVPCTVWGLANQLIGIHSYLSCSAL